MWFYSLDCNQPIGVEIARFALDGPPVSVLAADPVTLSIHPLVGIA